MALGDPEVCAIRVLSEAPYTQGRSRRTGAVLMPGSAIDQPTRFRGNGGDLQVDQGCGTRAESGIFDDRAKGSTRSFPLRPQHRCSKFDPRAFPSGRMNSTARCTTVLTCHDGL